MICIICKTEIKKHYIYLGKDKYRHQKCRAGSTKWLNSSIGKQSSLYDYFKIKLVEN